MFENAKVGDRVWDFVRGWGTIKNIHQNRKYPIEVKFNNTLRSYTFGGFIDVTDKKPILFWDKIQFEIPKKSLDLELEEELRKLEITPFKCGKNNYHLFWSNIFEEITSDYKVGLQEPFTIFFTKESIDNFINNIKNKDITKEEFFTAYENVFGDDKF